MFRKKIINWIDKTFGDERNADWLSYVERITDKVKKDGKKYRIHEINIDFQRRDYDPKEVVIPVIQAWRAELDKITENSVIKFEVGDERLTRSGTENKINFGKSCLVSIRILHRQEL